MTSEKIEAKHGTTTVGVVYKDGLVLAADKRVSMGYLIANKEFDKFFKITDQIAMTVAGSVGDAQMLAKFLKAEVDLYKLNSGIEASVDVAASLMQNILFPQGKSFIPFLVQLIVAGLGDDGRYAIYTLDPSGSNIKETKFYSTGSGSPMAFGVLEDGYREGLTEDEAIKLSTRAITSSIRRDMASGEGIDVVVINRKGFRRLEKVPFEAIVKSK